jgi:hypothetical protein
MDQLDQKLEFFCVNFISAARRTRTLSYLATFRKGEKITNKYLIFSLSLSTVVLLCGSSIAVFHYIIGVNDFFSMKLLYWLAFVIGKVGLLTFNMMFALYMSIFLERLRIAGNTIK